MNRYKAIKVLGDKIDEHRLIAGASTLGFDIVVHHKDGDKRNNNPDNLEIMSRSEHCRLHGFGKAIRSDLLFAPSDKNTGVCRTCGIEKQWEDFRNDKNFSFGKRPICKDCANEYKRKWRARVSS